ncbi:MAG: hypothetical protein IGS38_16205 [Synechococcales cyanobacterium M58_A2018_015]|nr:hypothetical protein [Synechococcales cyanobacterium M58_A2018_015]
MMPEPTPRLELLVPWELPIEQPLSATEQARVERALQQLLRALQQPDAVALATVTQALTELGPVPTTPANVTTSKTPLKQPQINDFDGYFETVHVQSAEVAACIVRSLLSTYQRLLSLWQQSDCFDAMQIEQQKQGLTSYVYLLGRVFYLNLPQEDSDAANKRPDE